MPTNNNFADLLRQGIDAIQNKESINAKRVRKDIYNELGAAISRQGSTIDYYLRRDANVPRAIKEVEGLAREIFRRGGMDRKWLEQFLIQGNHPNPSAVCNELLSAEASQLNHESDTLYKWLKLHHRIKRFTDRKIISTTQVELQATSDIGVETVQHRTIAGLPNENDGLILEFMPGQRDDYGEIKHRIVKQNPELLVWTVLFQPPLRKRQIVSYAFSQIKPFYKYWTFEDYEHMFNIGATVRRYAYMRRTVLAPIEDFMISLEFPPGYPITFPSSGGFNVYRSSAEDHIEKTRLIAGKNFRPTLIKPKINGYFNLMWIMQNLA